MERGTALFMHHMVPMVHERATEMADHEPEDCQEYILDGWRHRDIMP
jgi:hypothetical protein